MFKRKSRFNQKRRSSRGPMATAGTVLLGLIVLEILLRAVAWISGEWSELAEYEGDRKIVSAYRLKFVDRKGEPYDGLPNRGRLAVQRSTAAGYKLVGDRASDFWRINASGFRADAPLALKKNPGEFRIFLLGGSTAFGYLSLNNQTTISSQLEELLNQHIDAQNNNSEKFRSTILPYFKELNEKAPALPPRLRNAQYRVINAAVPGYASGNELAELASQVLAYAPDLVIIVDGYADLMLPSAEEITDIPKAEYFLENSFSHFANFLGRGVSGFIANSYIIKGFEYWILRPHRAPQEAYANQLSLAVADAEVPLAKRLAPNAEELQRRVSRYRQNLEQMARLAVAAKIPLIIIVQPEITGRGSTNTNPKEEEILKELGESYVQGMKAGYAELGGAIAQLQKEFPKGVTAINGYSLYADFNERAFQDAVHLTDEANKALAVRLYAEIAQLLQQSSVSAEPPPN